MSRAGEERTDELQQSDNVKANSRFSKNSSCHPPSSFYKKEELPFRFENHHLLKDLYI